MVEPHHHHHRENHRAFITTPLLFLLDGVLSQDEGRTGEALDSLQQRWGVPMPAPRSASAATSHGNNNNNNNNNNNLSEDRLCDIVDRMLTLYPEFCSLPSEHDGSLPLHFAASLGSVPVARIIYAKYPAAAATANRKGKIPLHYAAREGRLAMVQFFLRVAPETARIATSKAKLALHFAAGEGHARIVAELLRSHPESARLASSKGKLALHFGARWGYLDVCQQLLEVYPEAVAQLDWEGSLPLHDAAREGQVDVCRYLVQKYPGGLRTTNLRHEVPLFCAVRSAAGSSSSDHNLELVLLMIHAWPLAGRQILRTVHEDDRIENWHPRVLELLLRGAVQNLVVWEDNNNNNDHNSDHSVPERGGGSDEPSTTTGRAAADDDDTAVRRPGKVKKAPRCKSPVLRDEAALPLPAKKRRRTTTAPPPPPHPQPRTFLPLHAALEAGASSRVVRHVLHLDPDGVKKIDDDGRYALHWAVCHPRLPPELLLDDDDLHFLTEEAASHRDRFGNLPLHLALSHRASVTIIKELLRLHPAAGVDRCHVAGRFYQKRPLDIALSYRCDLSTVFELLRVDPSYVSR